MVCLLSCSFKSTGTLILIFAVTGTDALATVFKQLLHPSVFDTVDVLSNFC